MTRRRLFLPRWLWVGSAGAVLAGAMALPAAAAAIHPAQTTADATPTAMPYQVVVPGLADSAAAPTATPSPTPSGSVQVTGTTVSDLNGDGTVTNLTVWGDVHNGLDQAISGVQLSATATAADGTVLSTNTGSARLDIIPAGGDAPFSLPLQMVTDPSDHVSVTVTGYTTLTSPPADPGLVSSVQPPQPFKVGVKDPKTGYWADSSNLLAAYGSITNTGSSSQRIDSIALAFEDSSGNVWLVATTGVFTATFPGADPQVLAPGQAGTFTVYVPKATLLSLPAGLVETLFINSTPQSP